MKNTKFLKKNLIAHRGLFNNKDIPENSIESFKLAKEKKYIIELDIHILKDKKIVVFHDHNLKRMTKKDKIIESLDYNQLKSIKLLKTEYQIPTLKEVLDLVNGKVPLIIELKSEKINNKKFCIEVSNILDKYKGKFAVKSFNPFVILWFKKHRPNYIRGLLLTNRKKTLKEKISRNKFILKKCKPDFLSCYYDMINNKKIKEYKKNNIVLGWTIKTPKKYLEYKDLFDNLICENMEEYDEKR